MQDHSFKQRPVVTEKNHGAAKARPKRKSLATFLIESEFKPFVFVGRCMQYFGLGSVAGFFLGAACLFGYAVFKPLPYPAKSRTEPIAQVSPTPSVQSKTVQLHGLVRDSAGGPMKEPFTVGVLASQFGPTQNSDGSFALEVPRSNSYDVALWDDETVKVYKGFAAEQDGNGYRLQQALPFLRVVRDTSAQNSRSRGQLRSQSGDQ